MRLARCLIKVRSTSWHMLAGYQARKAWRNFECVKDSSEVGRGERKPLLILLNTINESTKSGRSLDLTLYLHSHGSLLVVGVVGFGVKIR